MMSYVPARSNTTITVIIVIQYILSALTGFFLTQLFTDSIIILTAGFSLFPLSYLIGCRLWSALGPILQMNEKEINNVIDEFKRMTDDFKKVYNGNNNKEPAEIELPMGGFIIFIVYPTLTTIFAITLFFFSNASNFIILFTFIPTSIIIALIIHQLAQSGFINFLPIKTPIANNSRSIIKK